MESVYSDNIHDTLDLIYNTEVSCAIKIEDIIIYPTNELLSLENKVRV